MPFFTPSSFDVLSQQYGPRYKWFLLVVVGIGTVAGLLSTSSFNVAALAIGRDFKLGQEQVQWTMTGFMAAMVLGMLPAPWLLERIGFRRLFLSAVLLLAVSSVAGSFSGSFSFVILIRVLQGVATGVLQPLSMLVVIRLFPANMQGKASGILTLGMALTPAVAPAFGGVLVDHFGWQMVFLLNLPFCILALVLGVILLPSPRELKIKRFDWLGTLLLSVATLALVEGVVSLRHSDSLFPWTICCFGFAGLLMVLFFGHARRSTISILNPELFLDRSFAMGTIVSFTYGFGLYASTYLIPVFLQDALYFSATTAGSALMPGGLALAVATPIAGRMADRYPAKVVTIVGLSLFGISFLLFFLLGNRITYISLVFATVIGRIGLGTILPALNLASLQHLRTSQLAQSAVVVNYVRQLGGVMGIAIIAVFFEWRQSLYDIADDGKFSAYAESFLLLGGMVFVAIVAASFMKIKQTHG